MHNLRLVDKNFANDLDLDRAIHIEDENLTTKFLCASINTFFYIKRSRNAYIRLQS